MSKSSTWRTVRDLPDHKVRVSPDGIRVEEERLPDCSWRSTRTYPDGRVEQAAAPTRSQATKKARRQAAQ